YPPPLRGGGDKRTEFFYLSPPHNEPIKMSPFPFFHSPRTPHCRQILQVHSDPSPWDMTR
ncbi:MAG TPA: hypothetical protein DCS88_14765, partial [Alphaproteobacteria bacterium]|nr:hypothetical protein [Alphaproteobacteria bacterium]